MAAMHPNVRVVGLDLYEPKLSLQSALASAIYPLVSFSYRLNFQQVHTS